MKNIFKKGEDEMNKELKDLLHMMGDLTYEMFEEASKEAFSISCVRENDGDNNINLQVKGDGLAILLGLVGMEQQILKCLGCDEDTFEFIKSCVGTKKVNE